MLGKKGLSVPETPGLGQARNPTLKDHVFKTNLSYIERPWLKTRGKSNTTPVLNEAGRGSVKHRTI
jgi:hypothetical protein